MGFICRERASTADFLTSLTNPVERTIKEGFESTVPRTPAEFASRWQNSSERASLQQKIQDYNASYSFTSEHQAEFHRAHKTRKATMM